MRFSDSVNKFVSEEKVLLEFYVGVQDISGKTKQVKKAVEKGAEDLIETLLDVRHSADIRDVLDVGFLQFQSGEVPCVHGTFPRDSCINAVKVPCANPALNTPQPGSSPKPVKNGGDGEHPVVQGVGRALFTLGKVGGLGCGGSRRPVGPVFDAVVKLGQLIECSSGK